MSRTVAILGLGERGQSWARAFHAAGWRILGFDPNPDAGLPLKPSDWTRVETISGTVSTADWVVVCLPERLELLQKVLQRIQAEAPDTAVVAVATQAFDVDCIQTCAMRPAVVILADANPDGGFTFAVSQKTSPATRQTAKTVLAELAAHDALTVPPAPDYPADAESA